MSAGSMSCAATIFLFRVFQPLVQVLARFNRGAFRNTLPEIHREIQAAGLPRFWTAAEYLGKLELIALLLSPLYVFLCFFWFFDLPGVLFAVMFTVLTAWMLRRRLAARARYRLLLIKRRMPFLLDLLTLLMEAGSTFMLGKALKQGSRNSNVIRWGTSLGGSLPK